MCLDRSRRPPVVDQRSNVKQLISRSACSFERPTKARPAALFGRYMIANCDSRFIVIPYSIYPFGMSCALFMRVFACDRVVLSRVSHEKCSLKTARAEQNNQTRTHMLCERSRGGA